MSLTKIYHELAGPFFLACSEVNKSKMINKYISWQPLPKKTNSKVKNNILERERGINYRSFYKYVFLDTTPNSPKHQQIL